LEIKTNTKKNNNELTAFVVGDNIFRVISSNHGLSQMKKRSLDSFSICSSLLAMGLALEGFNNSNKHIMIQDKGRNITCIFAVENYTIVLITIIDKTEDVWVKDSLKNKTQVVKYA
jgi:hypothetical protein